MLWMEKQLVDGSHCCDLQAWESDPHGHLESCSHSPSVKLLCKKNLSRAHGGRRERPFPSAVRSPGHQGMGRSRIELIRGPLDQELTTCHHQAPAILVALMYFLSHPKHSSNHLPCVQRALVPQLATKPTH